MVKSMTGYGRFEKITDKYKIILEIKSVNHRYLDVNIKQPNVLNPMENDLRNMIKKYAGRGKIDVFIRFEDYSESFSTVVFHPDTAKGYLDAAKKASDEFGVQGVMQVSALLRYPEVITLQEEQRDVCGYIDIVKDAFDAAGEMFRDSREKEGEVLYNDIMLKLDNISDMVNKIEIRSPEIIEQYRDKILSKVEELLGDKKIDDSVLATELVVFSDKICVDEETVRLKSHITAMKDSLNSDIPIGRKLDFIAQEMNREANTILSKANDMQVSAIAIDLKTEIEKIREQIQNIE